MLFCYEQFDELTLLHLKEFDKKKLISVETDIVVDHYKEEKFQDSKPGKMRAHTRTHAHAHTRTHTERTACSRVFSYGQREGFLNRVATFCVALLPPAGSLCHILALLFHV